MKKNIILYIDIYFGFDYTNLNLRQHNLYNIHVITRKIITYKIWLLYKITINYEYVMELIKSQTDSSPDITDYNNNFVHFELWNGSAATHNDRQIK